MLRLLLFCFCAGFIRVYGQLLVARDTITVIENNKVLKMAWANGINHSNVSNMDLNGDSKNDLVVFDRINSYGVGRFRCFINTGSAGQINYRHDPALSYYFPRAFYWALLRDYNGDGMEDLFCSTTGGIKVYKNVGTPQHRLQFVLKYTLLLSDYGPPGSPSISNLYASSVGLPAIEDVDKDGDLDILTFSALGVYMEFHQNMSVENHLGSDSMSFRRADYCWGDFSESSCSVSFNQCPGRKMWDSLAQHKPDHHAGACITCIDSDGDNDQDLIIGDVECTTVQYIHNSGDLQAPVFNDTTKLYPNFPVKNTNGTYINIKVFPCAYNVDADGDNRKDLIATPNAFGTENFQSVWLFRNASTTATANLQLVKKNFLQDEMIEVGQNSFPALIDYDADGLMDLLIGNAGYYINDSQKSRLTLYKNIGSSSVPVFSLITRDYASLSTYSINNIAPAIGDIDNDGDVDICIGNSSGQVHWLQNTAGSGKPCNFSVLKINPFSFTTVSSAAAPQLFDFDLDGKLDLMIGMKNGNIAYYRQTTTGTTITFSLITSKLGGVDVTAEPGLYAYDGFAVPFFYRELGLNRLLVGSVSGRVRLYNVPSPTTSVFPLLNTDLGYYEGSQSAPWYEDINGDAMGDLFLGNASGGLSFFSSASPYVGLKEAGTPAACLLYPNPVADKLYISASLPANTILNAHLYNVSGKLLRTLQLYGPESTIDMSEFENGFYMIRLQSDGSFSRSFKFIKQ